MKLSGRIEIAAPPRTVWDLVVDPASLSRCVPGVSDVRQVDERTFQGSITAAVGPMEGDFAFTSVLDRADFPDDLEVRVEGIDSVTKSRLEARVRAAVEPMAAVATGDAEGTVLTYDATLVVKGRLAILGEMVLRATANLMITQVTRCLRSQLESPAAAGS